MGARTFPDQGAGAWATSAPGTGVDPGPHTGLDGTLWQRDSPIRRPALVGPFASALRRDGAGDHLLVTPVERGRLFPNDDIGGRVG